MLARKPADWLEATIEKKTVEILSKKGKGKGMLKPSIPANVQAEMFVQAATSGVASHGDVAQALENLEKSATAPHWKPKNGKPPSAAGGHNQQKGKGGKGKEPGKGGKGKQPKGPEKGKGKSNQNKQTKGGGKKDGAAGKTGKGKGKNNSKGKGSK